MKKYLSVFALAFLFASITILPAIAQDAASVVGGVADQVHADADLDGGELIAHTMSIIQGVKGSVPLPIKLGGLVLFIIMLMKVSFLRPLWDKLGKFKAFAGPILGVVLGLLLFKEPISLASIMAYLASGAGALPFADLLDAVKAIPGVGPVVVSIINVIQSVLGGAKQPSE